MDGIERGLCLDEKTGETIWATEWSANYAAIMASYATGPRAAPTVDGDRVYMAGAVGHVVCLDAKTGEILWKRDTVKDYGTIVPIFGTAFPPLVDGNLLITIVGGEDNALAVGFNKMTGEEVWRNIDTQGELCYSPPIIYEHAGVKQLLIWEIQNLHSLNPQTGEIYWSQPFTVRSAMAIGTPQKSGSYLLASSFYSGSMLIKLDDEKPEAKLVWAVKGKSEMPKQSEGLHSIITTPIIIGDYFYGACSYGELRGLELMTSKRVWVSDKFTRQGRWGSFFWVKNGDRYFVANDMGELIIMNFTPEGPVEIDRTMLIEPRTSAGFGPRKLFDDTVNWVFPAFANKHIIVRNDKEILRASLAAE
jgi:outer membrane protein assembly factor BamB